MTDLIRQNPVMVAECERSRRQLELVAEPCGDDEVERVLAPMVLVFGLGEQAKAKAFWKVYRDALSDIPRIALERAAAEYQRTGKWFPKPAELRDLARPHMEAFRQAAYRARKATEVVQLPPPTPPEDRPDPEEVKAVMAEFHAKMIAKDRMLNVKTKARRPPPQAKVDNSGVSAEMRALLARQAAEHGMVNT